MQMKGLETELDVALFDRARRPPSLNPTGRALIDRAREILRLHAGLAEQARQGGAVAGSLVIGVIPTASTGVLPAALALLRERYPRLGVRIENGLSTDLVRRVRSGEVDAAVLTVVDRVDRDLALHTVFEERLMVVAPGDARGRTDEALLTGLPFVRFNRRTGVGRIIERALRARRISVHETMALDSIEAILAMVRMGLGVTIAPERSVANEDREVLTCVPFGSPPIIRRVGLLERAGAANAPLTRALLGALREASRLPEQASGRDETTV
jgi:DNA-binding transcriptional LysR family regulator